MKQLSLLSEDNSQDDQVLETDIMRFMAIIGIVFWIIFALVKSMPFHPEDTASSILEPRAVITKTSISLPSETKLPQSKKTEKSKAPTPEPAQSKASSANKTPKAAGPKTQEPKALLLQFRTLDDLLALMSSHKVRLFCRARARGFDLFFEGNWNGDKVTFKSTNRLPPKLWEIKSGKAHSHFLALMVQNYPAIRTFPTREVLVSFADEGLGKRVEETLSPLEGTGKNGTISINRNGDVVYSANEQ